MKNALRVSLMAAIFLNACGPAKYQSHTGTPTPVETSQDAIPGGSGDFNPDGGDASPTPERKAEICEPFKSTDLVPSPQHGLIGQYRYQDKSAKGADKDFSSLAEILKNGKPGIGTIVMRDLNLSPRKQVDSTRPMNRQLLTAGDEVVSGQFILSLKTALALEEDEAEGFYHLGFLVNGAVEVGTWSEKERKYTFLMKSESLEKSGFKCARNFLNMKKGSPLKVLIRYAHLNGGDLTIQTFWKKVDSENSAADSYCDHTKPIDFYAKKSMGGVTPTAEFNALKKRGWKTLAPKNFVRDPTQAGLCVPSTAKKP